MITTPTLVKVRALRNVGIGMGRELMNGEAGDVNAVDADFLVQIEAAVLVDPADASRVAAAVEQNTRDQFSQAERDRYSGRNG
jgi:hypothetical protein